MGGIFVVGLVIGLLLWRRKRARKPDSGPQAMALATFEPHPAVTKDVTEYATTPAVVGKYYAPNNEPSDSERGMSPPPPPYSQPSGSSLGVARGVQQAPVSVKSFGNARVGFAARSEDELEISAGGGYNSPRSRVQRADSSRNLNQIGFTWTTNTPMVGLRGSTPAPDWMGCFRSTLWCFRMIRRIRARFLFRIGQSVISNLKAARVSLREGRMRSVAWTADRNPC